MWPPGATTPEDRRSASGESSAGASLFRVFGLPCLAVALGFLLSGHPGLTGFLLRSGFVLAFSGTFPGAGTSVRTVGCTFLVTKIGNVPAAPLETKTGGGYFFRQGAFAAFRTVVQGRVAETLNFFEFRAA